MPFCRRGLATLHHCSDERDSRDENGGTGSPARRSGFLSVAAFPAHALLSYGFVRRGQSCTHLKTSTSQTDWDLSLARRSLTKLMSGPDTGDKGLLAYQCVRGGGFRSPIDWATKVIS